MKRGTAVRERGARLTPRVERAHPPARMDVGPVHPQTRWGVVREIGEPYEHLLLVQRLLLERGEDGSPTGGWVFSEQTAQVVLTEPDIYAIEYQQFVSGEEVWAPNLGIVSLPVEWIDGTWICRHQNKLRYYYPFDGVEIGDCFPRPLAGD